MRSVVPVITIATMSDTKNDQHDLAQAEVDVERKHDENVTSNDVMPKGYILILLLCYVERKYITICDLFI